MVVEKIWWGFFDGVSSRNEDREEGLSSYSIPPSVQQKMDGFLREKKVTETKSEKLINGVVTSVMSRSIQVDGLPKSYDLIVNQHIEDALFQLFNDFNPEAVSVGKYCFIVFTIPLNNRSRFIVAGKGVAYVKLESAEKVDGAIKSLNNALIADRSTIGNNSQQKMYALKLTNPRPGNASTVV